MFSPSFPPPNKSFKLRARKMSRKALTARVRFEHFEQRELVTGELGKHAGFGLAHDSLMNRSEALRGKTKGLSPIENRYV